jgi:hypothetical protein
MSDQKVDDKKRSIDFSGFKDNFQALPWNWADNVFKRPTFFFISVGLSYAILILLTFFPDNGLMGPENLEEVKYFGLAEKIDSDYLLMLKHYPSINILLIALLILMSLVIRWRHKIPDFFQWLWDSGKLKKREGDLTLQYYQYLLDYRKDLLSKWGPLITGFALSLLTAGLVWKAEMFRFVSETFDPTGAFMLKLIVFVAIFWMFLIGQMCWMAYVTARYISQLPRRFSLRIRVSHPDKCGGLKPIGDFVLDFAIILIMGGAAFAAIAILDMDPDQVLRGVSTIFLFTLVGPLSALAVFLPIWNIHELMVQNRKTYLNLYNDQLKDLESVIFDHTWDSVNLEEAIQAKEKLEILKEIHPETTDFPVWPIRVTGTVLFMFSPQIVQMVFNFVINKVNWDSIELFF